MLVKMACMGIGIIIGMIVMMAAYVIYSDEEDAAICCRDCEHWDRELGQKLKFQFKGFCKLHDGLSDPNDYCAWAEPKGEDE